MSRRNGGGAIRIAVAATSAVGRSRLETLIRNQPDFYLAGSFATVSSLVSFGRSAELDVVVIDADSIDGLQPVPVSEAAIVLLTKASDGRSISRLLRSGVRAVLPRASESDEVLSAIYAAYDGLVLLSTPIAENLAAIYGDFLPEAEEDLSEEITARETDVLKMLAEGRVNKDIAARLGISEHTVKFHISSILAKLGASTRTEAVTVGIRRGLIAI
jgi:two-component system, NarL family, response regulator YdfI